ncbi:MAG: choice-of-anchor D domain-containing protein [Sorangiineae bacterium]|nr:choice-of-anchor D domain-containing protein [Polyangiaceae bacterium]MEB2322610.1 choice-of-anchor D domain-containing protein [Sorangiineae bacterium]
MSHLVSSRPLRTALSLLVATGALVTTAGALAQDADGGAPSGPCDPSTLYCSSATIEKNNTSSNQRLPIGIDTGWVPKCDPMTSDGHCDKKVQIDLQVALDPLNEQSIWKVEMPKGSVMSASWPDTSAFVVQLEQDLQKDGTFSITHTITPDFGLYLDAGSIFKGEIHIDASKLLPLLPIQSHFDYVAMGSTKFNPWGFAGATARVKGTDLANSQLFSITFEQLGKLVGSGGFNDVLEGSFSFNATTDIEFTYTTKQVKIAGSTGPISQPDGTTQFPMVDQDYLEFTAQTLGEIAYEGTLDFRPVINISSVAGFPITLSFPINVGLAVPISGPPIPVTFPNRVVHLPLPNVFAPGSLVDFGQVEGGDRKDKSVTIDNTGEMAATLEFTSDDPQFTVGVASTMIDPGDSFNLSVRFKPTTKGKQEATITVTSNDPDSPVQEFKVSGYGKGENLAEPDPEPEADGGSAGAAGAPNGAAPYADSSGCGCRTAGSTDEGAPRSALALLALGAVALLRRRRR